MENQDNSKWQIVVISLLVILLFFLLDDKTERFTPKFAKYIDVKQCDFNDKNLNNKCKEIRDGCIKLKKDETKMTSNLAAGCELKKDGKTVRETISNRRDCVTDVERLIRTKYAKKELCSQIKNMPENMPKNMPKNTKNTVEKLNNTSIINVLPFDKNGAFTDFRF